MMFGLQVAEKSILLRNILLLGHHYSAINYSAIKGFIGEAQVAAKAHQSAG